VHAMPRLSGLRGDGRGSTALIAAASARIAPWHAGRKADRKLMGEDMRFATELGPK